VSLYILCCVLTAMHCHCAFSLAQNDGPVTLVVGDNFDDVAIDPTKGSASRGQTPPHPLSLGWRFCHFLQVYFFLCP